MGGKFLIVEDDKDIAHALIESLTTLGRTVDHFADGSTALERWSSGNYELIVLDINLPGISGIEICKAVRRENNQIPIIMLTSRVEELDKVLALELGADDYITKPFSIRELIARVNAILRRSATTAAAPVTSSAGDKAGIAPITIGEVIIYPERYEVFIRGQKVPFTGIEWDILYLLASHPGRTFSRTQLMELLWGGISESYESTITAHLSRLRAKIEVDRDNPRYVLTIRGVGYRFVSPEELGTA